MNFSYVLEIKKIRSEHLVIALHSKKDIENFSFLHLSKEIVSDIGKSIQKKEDFCNTYFIGGKTVRWVSFIYTPSSDYQKKVIYYGKQLSKLEGDICIHASIKENILPLIEVSGLGRYTFQGYKTDKKDISLEVLGKSEWKKEILGYFSLFENIFLARDLGETSASDLTPEVFAQRVKKTKFKNIRVKILTYKDIQKKGLGLIEGVGKGSNNKPCMVIMEHIVNKKKPIMGIVGKGVTFDTGGNQIKPGDYMYDMKGDMGGAAVTYALMKELDGYSIDKNIVACLCLAENVVSGSSYKPSDILTGYTGKTIEVIHTDAEGRLVLADGMSYLGKNYKTERMMTIATLTGAVMVALGYRYAGVMGTDTKMIQSIIQYSKNHTEKYVELPFDDHFLEKTKSEIADYKNLDRSVYAGSSMGAAFLANFLENDELYTHIDIAGAYINEGEPYGKMPKGMTGFGVESLSYILRDM